MRGHLGLAERKYTPEGPTALYLTTDPILDRGEGFELMVRYSRGGYICDLRECFQSRGG